jgi:hypothetical protein
MLFSHGAKGNGYFAIHNCKLICTMQNFSDEDQEGEFGPYRALLLCQIPPTSVRKMIPMSLI